MARPLSCPECHKDFTFEQWAKAASCPHCGVRVSFFRASGQPEPQPDASGRKKPAATGGAAALRSGAGSSQPAAAGRVAARDTYSVFGKPLAWSRGWTVVFAIWAVTAALLVVARVEMGHLSVFNARETAAVAAVERAQSVGGLTTGQALALLARSNEGALALTGQRPKAYWYAFDRPWEQRVYVVWELDDPLQSGPVQLGWTVEGTRVVPDAATAAELSRVPGIVQEEQRRQQQQQTGLPDETQPVTIPGL